MRHLLNEAIRGTCPLDPTEEDEVTHVIKLLFLPPFALPVALTKQLRDSTLEITLSFVFLITSLPQEVNKTVLFLPLLEHLST